MGGSAAVCVVRVRCRGAKEELRGGQTRSDIPMADSQPVYPMRSSSAGPAPIDGPFTLEGVVVTPEVGEPAARVLLYT